MGERRPLVLVVDDDRSVLSWMASLLEAEGMEVLRAETAEEGLRRAEERPPDVAILDIKLPDLSGREVCRILKGEPRFGAPLVMHVTGVYTKPEEMARALEADADDYLLHPLAPRVFAARVKALLRLKAAEAERILLWTAIEEGEPVIIVTDLDAQIRYVNPAFERVTGYAKGEVLGKNPRILQSGRHDKAFYERLWAELLAGRTWRGDFVNKRKDGTLYHEAAIISPVKEPSGRTTAYVAVKRDVTKEREFEEKARRAEEMARLGRLVQGLAHEVRNPLFAIEVNAALLERLSSLGPEEERAVRFVREHVQRLNALFKDVLELGASEAGEKAEAIPAGDLLREAVAQLASVLPQAARRVVVQGTALDAGLRGYRHSLAMALFHLLKNAAEADPHGEIALVASDEEGEAVVRVEDLGPGLPPELGEEIFEPFVTGKQGRRGLGLALARRFVERSGGTLSGTNRVPPPGAVFTVRLPHAP